jgi:MFS family permease
VSTASKQRPALGLELSPLRQKQERCDPRAVRSARRFAEQRQLFSRVIRNRDVRRLELAWAASNLANRASAIAVAVYAYQAHGTAAVGLVLFVRLAVAAVSAPWLGFLADRRPRRQVLVASTLVQGLLLGAMAALALVEAAQSVVYVLAVLSAAEEPLFRSALAALTPSLVRTPEELTAANVLASGVESVGLFVGPALGALLLSVSSSGVVFAVTAGMLLVAVALVAEISVRGEPSSELHAAQRHDWLAGGRAIAFERDLRVVVGLYSTQTLVAGMLNVLVVVLAVQLLDLGTAGVGWLAGMIGIGAVLGIPLVAGIAGRKRLSGYFAFGLVLWGVPLVLIAAWPAAAPAFLLLVLIGVGNTLVDVTAVTLMQRGAPDEVLGRVFGTFEALVFLTMGLGSLLTPLLVSALGARGALLAAGLVLPVLLGVLWRPLASIDARAAAPRAEVELLRGLPMFAPLPPSWLDRLAKALVEEQIERGSVIFGEGSSGDRFYVIAEGRAAVEIGGRRTRTLKEGDFFGEIALLRDVPRTATVRALTALRLFALDRDIFVATITGHPASAEAVGSIVAARLPAPVIT